MDTYQPDIMPVISTYTDQDAVEDGVLVKLDDKHRVTRTVYDFLSTRIPASPPLRWPLSPGLEAMYPYKDQDFKLAALLAGLFSRYGARAKQIYENNEAGGIWFAALDATNDTILGLRPGAEKGPFKLWLMPNELGGLTLMFPEDY